MPPHRKLLFLAAAIAVGGLGWGLAALSPRPAAVAAGPSGSHQIGGPFALIDQNGKPVTERDFLGKPTAIYFGFTYCPEVCPTTLANLASWMKALGPDADRLNVVFISIDPERDTPKLIKAYLSVFDPRFRGLTGSPQDVAKAAHAFNVFYNKVPLDGGGYTVDHSTAIYLMDAKGRFVEPIGYGEDPKMAVASLKKLVSG